MIVLALLGLFTAVTEPGTDLDCVTWPSTSVESCILGKRVGSVDRKVLLLVTEVGFSPSSPLFAAALEYKKAFDSL